VQAVDHGVVGSYEEIATRFNAIANVVQESFATASLEPKLTNREELMQRTTPAKAPPLSKKTSSAASFAANGTQKVEKPQIMRKLMTRGVAEVLEQDKRVVYVGEDVEHGMLINM
jgi:ectoine hydroxylase-related dioxygenase (phytanoyl-CoA dioxygenase family)